MNDPTRIHPSPAQHAQAAHDAAAALGRALDRAGALPAPRAYLQFNPGEPMTVVVNVAMAPAEAAALADRLNESIDRVEVAAVVESIRELADGWEWNPGDRAALDALLRQLPGGGS